MIHKVSSQNRSPPKILWTFIKNKSLVLLLLNPSIRWCHVWTDTSDVTRELVTLLLVFLETVNDTSIGFLTGDHETCSDRDFLGEVLENSHPERNCIFGY